MGVYSTFCKHKHYKRDFSFNTSDGKKINIGHTIMSVILYLMKTNKCVITTLQSKPYYTDTKEYGITIPLSGEKELTLLVLDGHSSARIYEHKDGGMIHLPLLEDEFNELILRSVWDC